MKLAGLLVAASLGLAAPVAAGDFTYKGWRFDTSAVHGTLSDALVRAFQAQIDIVESLPIKPEIKAFLRDVDVRVEPSTFGGYGFYRSAESRRPGRGGGMHRVYLSAARPAPPNHPTLLSLLLLAYLQERVRDGRDDAEIAGYFDKAKHMDAFANRSAMMHSPEDFFTTSSAVVLWGRADREPFQRAKVRKALPDFYDWLVREFYPPGVSP